MWTINVKKRESSGIYLNVLREQIWKCVYVRSPRAGNEFLKHNFNEQNNTENNGSYKKIYNGMQQNIKTLTNGNKQFVVTNCSKEQPGSIVNESLKN